MFVYYSAKTSKEEFAFFAKAFADDLKIEEYNVLYSNGRTIISNDDPVDDSKLCEEKIAEMLQAKNSTTVFVANLETQYGPLYGLISRNGWESFDVQEYLQNLSEEKSQQLTEEDMQANAPTHLSAI